MPDLERFLDAQTRGGSYDLALSELLSGRKRNHWIWWVFPQLASLGRSGNARFYGIADAAEAADYLRHPVLGARYLEALRTVHHHVCSRAADLENLMGSHTDALKLVSSLTLFRIVAADVAHDALSSEEIERLAGEVLDEARKQGWRACSRTQREIAPGE
jgi:uncharacterized protein (DUF1810 family)